MNGVAKNKLKSSNLNHWHPQILGCIELIVLIRLKEGGEITVLTITLSNFHTSTQNLLRNEWWVPPAKKIDFILMPDKKWC